MVYRLVSLIIAYLYTFLNFIFYSITQFFMELIMKKFFKYLLYFCIFYIVFMVVIAIFFPTMLESSSNSTQNSTIEGTNNSNSTSTNNSKSTDTDNSNPTEKNKFNAKNIDIASDFSYFIPLYIAIMEEKHNKEFTDEEKVELFSQEYRKETDSFKRNDIKNELLPIINEQIDKFKKEKEYIIKIPVVSNQIFASIQPLIDKEQEKKGLSSSVMHSNIFLPEHYDFDDKHFPIRICEKLHDSNISNSDARVTYVPNPPSIPSVSFLSDMKILLESFDEYTEMKIDKDNCFLDVEEELARKIESLVNSQKVAIAGELYFKIDAGIHKEYGTPKLLFSPIYAKISYLDLSEENPFAKPLIEGKEFYWEEDDED